MSFRKNLEKIDFKGDFTVDVIRQIIAAHNLELERIAAGMPKKMAIGKKQSPEFLWNDGWNKAITECQEHVRRNAND